MNEIDRNIQTNINIQENSNLIWNNAEILRGLYKPHEYGEVILPMTVIKRFHDTLLPTMERVQKAYAEYKTFEVIEPFLLDATGGYTFYNTSKFTFSSLLSDPEHIEENFRAYLNGSKTWLVGATNARFTGRVTSKTMNHERDFVVRNILKTNIKAIWQQ